MSDLTGRTPRERWRQVDEILGQALEVAPEERAALLANACAGDLELLREVESLLLADQRAGGFLDSPPASPVSDEPTGTEAGPEPPRALLSPGTVLADRYRIEAHVGHGGMGAVYRARDLVLETDVAVKVLEPQLLARPGRMEAFRREVRLARLVTHPNVCRVHDIVEDGEVAFITMEYVPGESLAERLERAGELPLDWCLRVLADVARGLAAAHAAGVIHRDLKPGNVLLKQGTDEAVVADFGVAAEAAGPDGKEAARAGTRGYMAPEQAAGAPPDARSDLFSFGVLAHRMATGGLPGEEAAGELPPEIAGLVSACLEPDPSRRPAEAHAALRLLERATAKRTRPAWVRRGTVAAIVLTTALASALWWRPGQPPQPDPAGPIVAAADASHLDPQESWIGDAFQRLIVNDLIDAWGLEARTAPNAPLPPRTTVRSRLWRDAAGPLRASVTLPRGAGTHEIPASTLRELAEAAARRIAEGLVPEALRHPTLTELQEVGARDPEAWRQLRRARRAARMQHWELVRVLARDAIRRDPDFVMAWLELDLTYNQEDQARHPTLDKVVELGDRAQGLSPMSRLGVEFARRSRLEDEAGLARIFESFGALKLEGSDLLYVKTRLAAAAFSRGDPDAGVPALEWIAEKWPQDAAAPKQLANHYLGGDEPISLALALRHGKKAVALAPEDVAARADLALALLLAGDEAAARAHLGILVSADPEDKQDASLGEQNNRLFDLHMALGERDEAAVDARRLMMGSGIRHAQGRAALAAIDLSRGAFDHGLAKLAQAAEEYERLHIDSLALDAHWQHAWQAYSLGRHREAIAVATHVRRRHAQLGHSLAAGYARYVLGLETLARMETERLAGRPAAVDSLRQRLQALPVRGGGRAYFELLIRHGLEDWAGVAGAYRDLEAGGSFLAMIPYAAHALERLGRQEEAAGLYERLATHPNGWHQPYRRGQAWLRLGILRERAGDREGAAKAFDSLLRLWDQAPRDTPEIREAERRLAALHGRV